MVRPLFNEAPYIRLVQRSTRMFEQWDQTVGGTAGWEQEGFLRISDQESERRFPADVTLMKELGVPVEHLSVQDLRKAVPGGEFADGEFGMFLPEGGFADPIITTHDLAGAARRHGADIVEGAEVSSIETRRGRVQSVRTDQGTVSTRTVVNCAGAWGDRVAAMVDVCLPIEVHRTPTVVFQKPEGLRSGGPIISDAVNRVYWRNFCKEFLRIAHFGFTLDPADPDAFDESVTWPQSLSLRAPLFRRMGVMRRALCTGGFSALYDMTPDGHPIIGPSADAEGFWNNCGWSGNGFASAPALGECLSRLILGDSCAIDLSLFGWPRSTPSVKRAEAAYVHE